MSDREHRTMPVARSMVHAADVALMFDN